jgi:hypothetical protein
MILRIFVGDGVGKGKTNPEATGASGLFGGWF